MTTVPPARRTGPASTPPTPRTRPRAARVKPATVPAQRGPATSPPLPGSWPFPVTVDLAPAARPLSLNAVIGMAPRQFAPFAKSWRTTARMAALAAGVPALPPGVRLDVLLVLTFPGAHHRDILAGNYAVTLKPVIDGLADAGVIIGDDDRYVSSSAVRQVVDPRQKLKQVHRLYLAPEGMVESAYGLWKPSR